MFHLEVTLIVMCVVLSAPLIAGAALHLDTSPATQYLETHCAGFVSFVSYDKDIPGLHVQAANVRTAFFDLTSKAVARVPPGSGTQ